jgi:hypothetical protein
MSVFDPVTFLNGSQEVGFDTRFPQHKAGAWKGGYVGANEKDIRINTVNTGDGPRQILEVWICNDNPATVGDGGRPPARVRYQAWLDLTPQSTLDKAPGMNRSLGYLLTALGFQDKNGKTIKPWNPRSMHGMQVPNYIVNHDIRKDTGDIQAVVNSVAAA